MNKFYKLSIFLIVLLIPFSCYKKNEFGIKKNITWYTYTYSEFNGTLYTSFDNEILIFVICGTISGINCSLKINHVCSEEQFKNIKSKLESLGCKYIGTAVRPNIDGYPDLSQYISFVVSSDELNQIWSSLGLETE